MKDVTDAFLEAENLLRKYGFNAQADEVRAGLVAVQAEGREGYAQLAPMWSGAASVAEVYLHKDGETFTARQEKDNRALRAALTAIYEAMRAEGVIVEQAEAWIRS